jgi:glycosyltransferase involved in cell wall biosynthesis
VKFSLLVPSYNRPGFIREAVFSLLANAAPDVEIIISDDASPRRAEITGALSDVIASGRVTYIQQGKNLGWSNNRNALLDAARGEYVILMGDDDRLKPGAIDRLRYWTASHPDVSVFGVGYDNIDEYGVRIFTRCTPKPVCYETAKGGNWKEIFSNDAVPAWSHHPFTMCCRRTVAAAIRYNPKVDIADDVLFLYDALEQGNKFLAIPETLFDWRRATNVSGNYATLSGSRLRGHLADGLILAELANRPALRKEVKSLLNDAQFLARFCKFKRTDAQDLVRLLQVKPADGMALGNFIHERFPRQSIFQQLDRHIRAIKVMGLRHILNFLRDKWDQKQMAIRLRRKNSSCDQAAGPTGRK